MARSEYLSVSVAALALCLASCATSERRLGTTQKAEVGERAGWRIANEGEAISTACRLFGVAAAGAHATSAEVVTLEEDKTPFLHDQITKRPIWRVTIHGFKLRLPSAMAGEQDQYERTFDVFLDPRDGKLLKLFSHWPEGVADSAPEPEAASGEEQMSNAGRERFWGFPSAPPKVTFLAALDSIYLKSGIGGDPLQAKQIVAHYVMQSEMGCEPRCVWSISLRGIPPIEASYPGVPVSARDHMRHIVDAMTGKWLGATTSPQPQTPDGAG